MEEVYVLRNKFDSLNPWMSQTDKNGICSLTVHLQYETDESVGNDALKLGRRLRRTSWC